MRENCTDLLNSNLRLNKISILIFFQIYFKRNSIQLEIVVKTTYDLCPNKYFKILNLTFWGRNVLTRCLGIHSNSRDADVIKGLPISIETQSCYSCLVLYLHDIVTILMANLCFILMHCSNNCSFNLYFEYHNFLTTISTHVVKVVFERSFHVAFFCIAVHIFCIFAYRSGEMHCPFY